MTAATTAPMALSTCNRQSPRPVINNLSHLSSLMLISCLSTVVSHIFLVSPSSPRFCDALIYTTCLSWVFLYHSHRLMHTCLSRPESRGCASDSAHGRKVLHSQDRSLSRRSHRRCLTPQPGADCLPCALGPTVDQVQRVKPDLVSAAQSSFTRLDMLNRPTDCLLPAQAGQGRARRPERGVTEIANSAAADHSRGVTLTPASTCPLFWPAVGCVHAREV